MSAETLRRAAALMRERAEAAVLASGAGAWGFTGIGWNNVQGTTYTVMTDSSVHLLEANTEEQAEHIASWHPAVALAVADSLDQAAAVIEEAESGPLAMAMSAIAEPLVVAARAYLREPS